MNLEGGGQRYTRPDRGAIQGSSPLLAMWRELPRETRQGGGSLDELDLGYLGEISTQPLALRGVGTQTPHPLPLECWLYVDKPHLSLTSVLKGAPGSLPSVGI